MKLKQETGTEFAILTFQPLQKPKSNKERNMEKLGNFFKDESGAAAVEYGLLVALIAVVIIVSVTALGKSLSGMFNGVSTTIGAIPTAS
jgi:pilus assembly protein Flp/PilA